MYPFRNKASFYGEELLAPRPTPQAGGPPLIGCPRLLIQYIQEVRWGRHGLECCGSG